MSAPHLAAERGLTVAEGAQIGSLDYPNLVSCRVSWDGGSRAISGVVFGGKEPRIVEIDDYHLDARPEGVVLLMQSRDMPGVIGEIGTILGSHDVNIAEWRLGRNKVGGQAISLINLDSFPGAHVLDEIRRAPAVATAEALAL